MLRFKSGVIILIGFFALLSVWQSNLASENTSDYILDTSSLSVVNPLVFAARDIRPIV